MSRADRLSALVLQGTALLLLPVAYAAPLQVVTLAGLAAVVLLLGQATADRAERRWPRPVVPALLLAVLAVWGAITALWAPAPDRSLELALRFLGFGIGIAVLADAAQRLTPAALARLANTLVIGAAIAGVGVALALLVGRDVAGGLGLDTGANQAEFLAHFNRGTAVLAIVAWPLAMIVARRYGRLWALAALIAIAAVLVGLNPRTPTIALAVGSSVFGLAWLAPRLAPPALAGLFVAMVAAIPFMGELYEPARDALLAIADGPTSQVHRLAIWQFAAERIAEQPVFGWGLDASRALPGREVALELYRTATGEVVTGAALTLHPHNALIQVWLELGLPGLLIAALMFGFLVRAPAVTTVGRGALATRLAVLASALVVAQLSFGIWQGWWMAALGLAGVLTLALTPEGVGKTEATAT